MERTQRLILVSALFVLALAPRFYVLWSGSAQADDAFITYRCAENLAAGNGFVYNSGERVLGVTSPLYTSLLALFALAGAALPTVSLNLGLLASALTAALLFFFCRRLRLGAGSYLAPALYAFWPLAIFTDVSGMETPLFTLAALGFFYLLFVARYRSAALVAALAALLRPEGLALVALLFVFLLMIKRKRFTAEIVIVAALLAPWLVFSWMYFGSPIPHSITAKLALYLGFDTGSFWERVGALLDLDSMLGWLALLAALWGLVYLLIWTYWGFMEALFVMFIVGGLALSETHLFFWYKAPLAPLLVLFISAGAIGAYRLALSVSGRPALVKAGAALVLVAAIPAFGGQLRGVRAAQRAQVAEIQRNHLRAGRYLVEHAADSAVVVAEDIGYLGYTFRGLIVDRDGLVSPEIVPYNRRLDYTGALEMALRRYPGHWLYLAHAGPLSEKIVQSGILAERYELVGDFAQPEGGAYLLYRAVGTTTETSAD